MVYQAVLWVSHTVRCWVSEGGDREGGARVLLLDVLHLVGAPGAITTTIYQF